MDKLHRFTTIEKGIKFLDGEWLLNVYIIKSDPNEDIKLEECKRLIEMHLVVLEDGCMSDEFEYFKTGFAFLHYGNRGVDLTIWHVGKWGNTFETYVCSWYCYGRDTNNMEQLDSAEPMLCQYEMKYLVKEIDNISGIVDCNSVDEFRSIYLAKAV